MAEDEFPAIPVTPAWAAPRVPPKSMVAAIAQVVELWLMGRSFRVHARAPRPREGGTTFFAETPDEDPLPLPPTRTACHFRRTQRILRRGSIKKSTKARPGRPESPEIHRLC